MVCLSVCLSSLCLSRSCIVLKRQKISTWFLLLRRRQPPWHCLSKIVLKFGVRRSTHSFPNFFPNWPIICWFERRAHSMANCDRMVRDSATVTMESQQKTTIGLSIVPSAIADRIRPPLSPKMGVANVPPTSNFATCAATWRIWQKSRVAFCQITLQLPLATSYAYVMVTNGIV